MESKPHDWVGNRMKEREGRQRYPYGAARWTSTEFDELFDLVKARDEYR